jgi:hypothetical protein
MIRRRGLPDLRVRSRALAAAWLCLLLPWANAGRAEVVPPPNAWALNQNDPNPFCAALDIATQIGFAAPQRAHLRLVLLSPDSTAVVRTCFDVVGLAGSYTFQWDGRDDSTALVPDGRYPYTLVATDADTQVLLFSGSKAVTVRCVTGANGPAWSGVKALFR